MVLHIAGRKHTWHACGGKVTLTACVGHNITTFHFQLAFKNVGVRLVANGNKYAFECDIFSCASIHIFNTHASHARFITQYFI